MSMCRARAAWRTHASAWNGCCSILSGVLAAVERLAPHAIPAGPGTDGAVCFGGLRRRLAPQPALPRLSVRALPAAAGGAAVASPPNSCAAAPRRSALSSALLHR